jgi:uncharacterized protein YjbJ (UPF0337 family)
MKARIKGLVRSARYKGQQTRGRAKQIAAKGTGNSRLRREGKIEEFRSRFIQRAVKIKKAILP